uniref:Uncharacterized protein n=1 Tax=Anguilla anguilla TaxID=7936 RepID=A0A0E9TC30_ANGAN
MQPPGKVSKTLNRYIYPPGITYKNNLSGYCSDNISVCQPGQIMS